MKRKHVIPKPLIPESKSFLIREIHAPHFDPTFHLHPEFQISYVVKGEGNRFIGDSVQPFKANDLVLLGPNLPHVWRNHKPYFEKNSNLSTTVIVLYFKANFLGHTIQTKEEFESIKHLLNHSQKGLEITGKTKTKVCRLMVDLLSLTGPESIIQLLKILNVLADSEECHIITHTHPIAYNTAFEAHRMNDVYDFVMKHFHKKIKLEEVADIACMTKTSFSRYFKSRSNKSFSDFLKEIRVEHACKLLKEGKMNIARIGYESGFHTPSNFNKQFKKVTGKQPREYRDEYHKITYDSYH